MARGGWSWLSFCTFLVVLPPSLYVAQATLPTEIRLLGIYPQSGAWTGGIPVVTAVELALEEINSNRTLLPSTTLLHTALDDGCSQGGGVSAALQGCGPLGSSCGTTVNPTYMDAIIGSGCSSSCEATALLTAVWKMPQISWGCESPTLSNKVDFPYFVRAVAPATTIANALLSVVTSLGWEHLALITQSDGSFTAIKNYFAQEAITRGVAVLADESWAVSNTADLTTDSAKLIARTKLDSVARSNVRIVVLLGYAKFNRALLLEAHRLGMTGAGWQFIALNLQCILANSACPGPDGAVRETDESVITAASGLLSAGVSPPSGARKNAYLRAMSSKTGETVEQLSAWALSYPVFGYDAVWQYAHALHAYGKDPRADKPAFFETLKATSFEGASGFFRLDNSGDRSMLYDILSFRHASVADYNAKYSATTGTPWEVVATFRPGDAAPQVVHEDGWVFMHESNRTQPPKSLVLSSLPDPIITAIEPTATRPEGGETLRILGRHFTANEFFSVSVGSRGTESAQRSQCENAKVIADNEATCVAPPGVGVDHILYIVLGGRKARSISADALLSYFPPLIAHVSGVTWVAPGSSLTVTGRYFYGSSLRCRLLLQDAAGVEAGTGRITEGTLISTTQMRCPIPAVADAPPGGTVGTIEASNDGGEKWSSPALLSANPTWNDGASLPAKVEQTIGSAPVVVVALPSTAAGCWSTAADQIVGGANAAVEKINGAGLFSRPLEVLFVNTSKACPATTTNGPAASTAIQQALQSLTASGGGKQAIGLVGPYTSTESVQVLEDVAQPLTLPMVGYSAANTKLADKRRFSMFVRLYASNFNAANAILSLCADNSWYRIAVLTSSDAYSRDFGASMEANAQAWNAKILHRGAFSVSWQGKGQAQAEANSHAMSIAQTGARVIFVETNDNDDLTIALDALERAGYKKSGKWVDPALQTPADTSAGNTTTAAGTPYVLICPSCPIFQPNAFLPAGGLAVMQNIDRSRCSGEGKWCNMDDYFPFGALVHDSIKILAETIGGLA